ncbi:MAG: recombination regulator RecX [Treponema sp.]|jgi:regulatory protein|nr:recombination regulator RecX [Treponema sp.]
MTIVSLKTENADGLFTKGDHFNKNELSRIELSDGSLFSFKICYLPPEFLNSHLANQNEAEGKEISAAEEAAYRYASACLRAEKASLRLIARAEQCSAGLSRKLQKRGHEAACINAVISRLSELKLIDDLRFARLWLESRLHLTRSPRRLSAGLCVRGIDRGDAGAALKAVLDEEAELTLLTRFVKKYARKNCRRSEGGDVTCSLKYLLKSEGFSPPAIERFMDGE